MQSSRAFVTHVPSSVHPESAAGSSGAGGWLDADASLPSSERSPHRADRRQPLTRSLMALMVCSALAACGGGGGGSAVNTNPDPQAVTPVTPSVPPSANNQGAQGNNGTSGQNGTSSDNRGQGDVAGGNAASGNSSQGSAGNGNQNGATGGSNGSPGTGNGSGKRRVRRPGQRHAAQPARQRCRSEVAEAHGRHRAHPGPGARSVCSCQPGQPAPAAGLHVHRL